jgi:hypothetical protein
LLSGEDEVVLAIGALAEKETTLLNHENHFCRNYETESFVECCKTTLDVILSSRINCSIPGIQGLISDQTIEECSTKESAVATFKELALILYEYEGNNSFLGCEQSCTQTGLFKLKYFLRKNDFCIKSFEVQINLQKERKHKALLAKFLLLIIE